MTRGTKPEPLYDHINNIKRAVSEKMAYIDMCTKIEVLSCPIQQVFTDVGSFFLVEPVLSIMGKNDAEDEARTSDLD